MFDLNRTENSILHEHISKLMREKSDLEKQLRSKKYWKDKAEKLQKENIILKEKLKYAELALNIWSNGQSEFILGKNYEQQFENGMPKYKSDLFK